jgi:hypothetical protein
VNAVRDYRKIGNGYVVVDIKEKIEKSTVPSGGTNILQGCRRASSCDRQRG